MDCATIAAKQAGGLCDRHHISSATKILGLNFRNIKKFPLRMDHEYKF